MLACQTVCHLAVTPAHGPRRGRAVNLPRELAWATKGPLQRKRLPPSKQEAVLPFALASARLRAQVELLDLEGPRGRPEAPI